MLNIAEWAARLELIFLVISLIVGLFQCFFGYKFLKFWITVLGFTIGFAAGLGVSSLFTDSSYIPYIIAILAGALAAFLSFKLYIAGIFIFTGLIAAGALLLVLSEKNLSPVILSVICVAVFILAGILAVKFQKPIIIIITSVSGATAASNALSTLIEVIGDNKTYSFITFAALTVCGILLQFVTNRDKKK